MNRQKCLNPKIALKIQLQTQTKSNFNLETRYCLLQCLDVNPGSSQTQNDDLSGLEVQTSSSFGLSGGPGLQT